MVSPGGPGEQQGNVSGAPRTGWTSDPPVDQVLAPGRGEKSFFRLPPPFPQVNPTTPLSAPGDEAGGAASGSRLTRWKGDQQLVAAPGRRTRWAGPCPDLPAQTPKGVAFHLVMAWTISFLSGLSAICEVPGSWESGRHRPGWSPALLLATLPSPRKVSPLNVKTTVFTAFGCFLAVSGTPETTSQLPPVPCPEPSASPSLPQAKRQW